MNTYQHKLGHQHSVLPEGCQMAEWEGGGRSIQVGYDVIAHGLCTQLCNCGGVCSLAETEPPGLGFAWGLLNNCVRGWREVHLREVWCDHTWFALAIMQSQGGRHGVRPCKNWAAGVQFCLEGIKWQWERVEGVHLSGVWCDCAWFAHTIVQSQGGRHSVRLCRNRAVGAQFCLEIVKQWWERVEGGPFALYSA